MIDNDLIPSILLIAIEENLKPHDAMDFTVQLKLVPFEHNSQKGSLTQRYRPRT